MPRLAPAAVLLLSRPRPALVLRAAPGTTSLSLASSLERGNTGQNGKIIFELHYLNPVPIHEIYERWISKSERGRLEAISKLKGCPR